MRRTRIAQPSSIMRTSRLSLGKEARYTYRHSVILIGAYRSRDSEGMYRTPRLDRTPRPVLQKILVPRSDSFLTKHSGKRRRKNTTGQNIILSSFSAIVKKIQKVQQPQETDEPLDCLMRTAKKSRDPVQPYPVIMLANTKPRA